MLLGAAGWVSERRRLRPVDVHMVTELGAREPGAQGSRRGAPVGAAVDRGAARSTPTPAARRRRRWRASSNIAATAIAASSSTPPPRACSISSLVVGAAGTASFIVGARQTSARERRVDDFAPPSPHQGSLCLTLRSRPLSTARGRRRSGGARGTWRRGRRRVDPDGAAVEQRDLARDGQSEAEPLLRPPSRRCAETARRSSASLSAGMPGPSSCTCTCALPPDDGVTRHLDDARLARVLDRVADEVRQQLIDARRVPASPHRVGPAPAQIELRVQRAKAQRHLAHDGDEIAGARLELELARLHRRQRRRGRSTMRASRSTCTSMRVSVCPSLRVRRLLVAAPLRASSPGRRSRAAPTAACAARASRATGSRPCCARAGATRPCAPRRRCR